MSWKTWWYIWSCIRKRWQPSWGKARSPIAHLWIAVLLCSAGSIQDKVTFMMIITLFLFYYHYNNLLLSATCSFLHNNVTEKVLLLTRRKEKPLVAAAVRFVRTLLSVCVSSLRSSFFLIDSSVHSLLKMNWQDKFWLSGLVESWGSVVFCI